MKNNKAVKSASIIIVISIVSKVFGLLRDTLMAKAFGTTFQTDAYNMSITVPNILFGVIGAAIVTTFIPILSETYKEKGKEEMFRFANNIMNILLSISLVLCIVGIIFAPYLVKIVAPNFEPETYNLTVSLTKISMISILFMAMNSGYTAILQTLDDFVAPALIGIALNIPIIVYILLGNHSILGLTIATLIGNAMQVIVQIPWLIKHKYKYSIFVNLKDKRIAKMFSLIMPIIIGASVNQINSVVDKTIGSGLPEGSISALNYAQKINGLVYSVFAVAIITVVYPKFSRAASAGEKDNLKLFISKAINNINLVMIPATLGIMVLSVPIVRVIYQRGEFDEKSVIMTSTALIFYSIGVLVWGIEDIYNRAFYAMQDTKTPMIIGIIGVSTNIIFNLILVRFMGLGGLALSTSISAFVCTIILIFTLRRKMSGINGLSSFKSSLKIFVASFIMATVVKYGYQFLELRINYIIAMIISIIIGVALYAILILIFKVPELYEMIDMIKEKLNIKR